MICAAGANPLLWLYFVGVEPVASIAMGHLRVALLILTVAGIAGAIGALSFLPAPRESDGRTAWPLLLAVSVIVLSALATCSAWIAIARGVIDVRS